MGQAADAAYAAIKDMILGGKLPPNALLDEAEIAGNLGMSRTPVREGLLRLRSESLVEIARGKGIRVLPLSTNDMRETYQVISGLEMVAVSLLAEKPQTRESIAPLIEAVAGMEAALAHDDLDAWGDADEAFHRELLRLSGNAKLYQVGCQLRDFSRRAHRIAVRLQTLEYRTQSTATHAALLEKLIAGEPIDAWSNHLAQRRRGEDALVGIVQKYDLHAL
ncbi:GntR family transcriptional regulator [Acuticoccus kandeliae]|uniref:GntR family transcriptional regulator n=1 Tax=Acuticoccus kandeliae TaxID=2073160 RepID=UPI000D3E23AF|nr:GntR family transcriptional regulator [Acuticoccus kandeliae]